MTKHKEADGEFLIKTFVSMYDNWKKSPNPDHKHLERMLDLLREQCDNYGF
jgi:hypothetical protein